MQNDSFSKQCTEKTPVLWSTNVRQEKGVAGDRELLFG